MTGTAEGNSEHPGTHQGRPAASKYVFRLFVAGGQPNSERAKTNLQRLCETYLRGRYEVEIIDVLEDYRAALENDIVVTPTLIVRVSPLPARVIGDLSDVASVVGALGLRQDEA